ncbi:tumor susceptibility gene 101 protein-like isoform X1 [Macrosteles quadrilineatus]|uniref:tumor susceptibility gene 101 protein-like isoform X1 n=1 Tax=Macrosteles quadrilineatus TaxID=74068 RepID=UPI0023E1BAFF|nr:tumor susceptibility gene 101 protein-like isoform X1 [Macrosteles quadrilineatus]
MSSLKKISSKCHGKKEYDWYKKITKSYLNQERTFQDITRTVSFYRGLAIKVESYVMANGRSKQLVCLNGTIPVTIVGNTYNIPVCIWLMDTHPNHAPVCFVKPTPDMQIKVSMFVDHNGKIYLPYLHDWTPNQSDLLGLIQVMICTFGEQPPVYAKPKTDTPAATPYPTQPYMPMPGASGGNPPYPPYPLTQGYQPAQNTPYPPYPVYPPTSMYPPAPGSYPRPAYPPQPTPTPPTSAGGTGTINEEHIRISLLSAVEEKLRRRLDEQYAQSRAELDILQQSSAELAQGKQRLDKIIERLDNEKNELERNISLLKEKEVELDKALSRLSDEEPIDVDEAVTTTAPLYKQILNAFAEEAATEDAIYYMGEALRRGVIDLDVFLKQVRTLSRKQFMLRALMHKCRQRAGLVG